MAKIFAYNGVLGFNGWKDGYPEALNDGDTITKEHLTEALLNDPTQDGQLGFVCDMSKCQITAEAIEILKNVPMSRHAIGDVDVFKAGDTIVISWLGGVLCAKTALHIEGSSSYDITLLPEPSEVEIPQSFIDFVDNLSD